MRFFVDTNILVYTYDNDAGRKQAVSRRTLTELRGDVVISTQVIAEFYTVMTRKLGLDLTTAREAARNLTYLPVVPVRPFLVMRAIDTSISNIISLWDAMIVEAAVEGGCSRIISEDLNPGQVLRNIEIVNPFESL